MKQLEKCVLEEFELAALQKVETSYFLAWLGLRNYTC